MEGKKILLAITGSIAAYKAASLVRLFIKSGAEVKVVMTPSAKAFISPLTISTLSKNEVHTEIIDDEAWNNHVDLGLWSDVMIIAPATATTLAKMAHGICDTIVTAVYLSAKCPVYFAPAMDRDMWLHPATQNNIQVLLSYGNKLIDAETGELASGLVGKGRMAEPEEILAKIKEALHIKQDLSDKLVLITAGPTYEALDPVRYLGNHSSGKMGIALAETCASRGATVELILGPSNQKTNMPGINTTRVKSGADMLEACQKYHAKSDITIFTAAVADYMPVKVAAEKIKKDSDLFELKLKKTTDIAATLGKQKKPNQVHVGFALETKDEEMHAKKKLNKKNFDFIVLNSLNDRGAGFKLDTNKITIYTDKNQKIAFELKSKIKVAQDIVNTLVDNYV